MIKIFIKKWPIWLLIIFSYNIHASSTACDNWPSWFKPACQRLHQIWTEGDNELYLTGFAWHNRYTYDAERIKTYNENAWGGGLGKGFYDKENNNWHGLYAFAFLDSHKKLQPVAGYSYLKLFKLHNELKAGLGLSAFLTARPDINNNIPFPGVLPWVTLSLQRATLAATYIPGHKNVGNVLFIFGKYTF